MPEDFFNIHDANVTLVDPLIAFRQTGHFLSAGAHCPQHTKCPHGKNTMAIVLSQQILHNFDSFRDSFSFIASSVIKKIKSQIKTVVMLHCHFLSTCTSSIHIFTDHFMYYNML